MCTPSCTSTSRVWKYALTFGFSRICLEDGLTVMPAKRREPFLCDHAIARVVDGLKNVLQFLNLSFGPSNLYGLLGFA